MALAIIGGLEKPQNSNSASILSIPSFKQFVSDTPINQQKKKNRKRPFHLRTPFSSPRLKQPCGWHHFPTSNQERINRVEIEESREETE
jgi:hypothetical protein